MKIWGAVQKVSRPMLLCQEMSQMLPIPPQTAANTQAQMCHGTPVETSAEAACRAGFHSESAESRSSSDCLSIQINDTGQEGSLHGQRSLVWPKMAKIVYQLQGCVLHIQVERFDLGE